MRLEPKGDWIIGIAMIHKKESELIIRPDIAKGSSRCFLVEKVGPGAAGAGIKRGDIVCPEFVGDQLFYGGMYHRGVFEFTKIIDQVHDVTLDEFVDLYGKPIDAPWCTAEKDNTKAAAE